MTESKRGQTASQARDGSAIRPQPRADRTRGPASPCAPWNTARSIAGKAARRPSARPLASQVRRPSGQGSGPLGGQRCAPVLPETDDGKRPCCSASHQKSSARQSPACSRRRLTERGPPGPLDAHMNALPMGGTWRSALREEHSGDKTAREKPPPAQAILRKSLPCGSGGADRLCGVAALNFCGGGGPTGRSKSPAGPMRRCRAFHSRYRHGSATLTRTFPTPDQIEEDLRRLQGKVLRGPNLLGGRNLENRPQRAGKYG